MEEDRIKELYLEGSSCLEIAELLGLGARRVQRFIQKQGITRDKSETFLNAIKRGRMVYTKMPKEQLKNRKRIQHKERYAIFEKYGFKCCKCGNTAKEARIQIDHIDNNPSNNALDNLQVVCEPCNKGKMYMSV